MRTVWALALLTYVAGVTWGLFKIDARPGVRIGLAVLWPLGPLTFLVTLAVLVAAAAIAFPAFGLLLIAAAVLAVALL
jgi:hypothetical protein